MAAQECDLQVILRKLNEIDKRTKDTEQALKLLGRGLIDGSIGGGASGGNGAQLVSNRQLIDNASALNRQIDSVKNSIIDLRPQFKALEDALRQASGGRTLDDLQAGGANLRGVSNDAREAKVIGQRVEKLLKEIVVPIGVIDATVKRTDKRVNDMQFVVNKSREDITKIRQLANDSYAALKVFSPLIRDTRKLANDTFAGLVSLSPIIRKTAQNVNDGLFVTNRIRSIIGDVQKSVENALKLTSDTNFGVKSVLTALKSLPNHSKQLTEIQLMLGAIAAVVKNADNTPLINSAWNNLLLTIRGEHSLTRSAVGGQITANTTVLNSAISANANALNQRIDSQISALRGFILSLDGNSRAGIIAAIGANASAINLFTKREIDALKAALQGQTSDDTKIDKVLKYCRFDFDMQGYSDFAQWNEQDQIIRGSLTQNVEGFLKTIGAALFTAQPINPQNPGQGSNPVGTLTMTTAYERSLAHAAIPYMRAGLHRLPASVPSTVNYVPTQQNPNPPMVSIGNAVDLSMWQFRQTEGTLGFFPAIVKHKGKDDVVRDIKIDTVSDGIAELMGLALINDGDTDVILESILRVAGDVIQTKATASLGVDYGNAIADFLGYKSEQGAKKMPTNINPLGESLDDVLKPGEVEIITHDLKEPNDNDIITKINRLIMMLGMIQVGFGKRFPSTGSVGLDGDVIRSQLQTSDAEWEQFLVWLKTQYARTPDLGSDDKISKATVVDKSSRLISDNNPP